MKKIQIIVEQIEFSKTLIKQNTEASLRMSLVLLDNAIEILMYRRIMDEFSHSDVYKRLLEKYKNIPDRPEIQKNKDDLMKNIISDKKMKSIYNSFPEKTKFLSSKKMIKSEVASLLTSAHRYRNEVYHNDKSRKGSIKPVVMLLYETSCNFLEKLDTYSRSYRSDEMDELNKFFARYGLVAINGLSKEDHAKLARHLMSSMKITSPSLRSGLRNHLEERIKDTAENVKFIKENSSIGFSNKVLPDYPKVFKQLQLKLRNFENKKNKIDLFTTFVDIENYLEPFEKDMLEKASAIDEFIQFQIDLARGK